MSQPERHADLEDLVSADWSGERAAVPPGRSRSISDTFTDVVAALRAAEVPHVLVGALAFGLYARPRATRDIDLLALESARRSVGAVLRGIDLDLRQDLPYQQIWRDPTSGVDIDVLFGEVDPEQSAVEDPNQRRLFDTPVLVIKPEYLLWMYCLSDQLRHAADAVALLESGHVDLGLLRRHLQHARDTTAAAQLDKLLTEHARTRHSGYDPSRRRRRPAPE